MDRVARCRCTQFVGEDITHEAGNIENAVGLRGGAVNHEFVGGLLLGSSLALGQRFLLFNQHSSHRSGDAKFKVIDSLSHCHRSGSF